MPVPHRPRDALLGDGRHLDARSHGAGGHQTGAQWGRTGEPGPGALAQNGRAGQSRSPQQPADRTRTRVRRSPRATRAPMRRSSPGPHPSPVPARSRLSGRSTGAVAPGSAARAGAARRGRLPGRTRQPPRAPSVPRVGSHRGRDPVRHGCGGHLRRATAPHGRGRGHASLSPGPAAPGCAASARDRAPERAARPPGPRHAAIHELIGTTPRGAPSPARRRFVVRRVGTASGRPTRSGAHSARRTR